VAMHFDSSVYTGRDRIGEERRGRGGGGLSVCKEETYVF
jgi:hypothetical protein